MALCMQIALPTGVTANYSCIGTTQVYYRQSCLDVTVLCYLDGVAAGQPNTLPLTSWSTRLTFRELGSREPTMTNIYNALKRLPFWATATDC